MEKCILGLSNSGKFLNIINNQYIDGLVEVDKVVSGVITHRVSVLHLE